MKHSALFCAAMVLFLALPANAQPATDYVAYLDLDNNVLTGCTQIVDGNPIDGIEEILTTRVVLGSNMVGLVNTETCDPMSGMFGPPTPVTLPVAPPWPVGVGLGTNGATVVESYLANTSCSTIRFYFASLGPGGSEDFVLMTATDSPIRLNCQSILEIPTLSPWSLALFTLVLAGLAAGLLRYRGVAAAIFAVLLLGTLGIGVAWAMVTLDGDPADWTGGALATDAAGDAIGGADIVAVFAQEDANTDTVFVRFDVATSVPPICIDGSFATDEDSTVGGDVTAANPTTPDSDPDLDPLTVAEVNGVAFAGSQLFNLPSGATVNINDSGTFTYDPNGAFDSLGAGAMDTDTFTYTLGDGTGGSCMATVTVDITGINDPPVLAPVTIPTVAFVEDGPSVAIAGTITVTDPDDTQLASATVSLTNLQDAGAEILAAVTGGTSITANYVAPTLTLTGPDTLANFQAVLRSVTYANTSDTPTEMPARVLDIVANDGTANSNTATSTVTVTAVNDAPVKVAGGGGPAAFTEGMGAVAIDPGVTVTDADDVNLASATVTITNLLDAGLETLAANTGGTSIVANYVAPTLTLTGPDTVANFQAVLQSVTYNNTSTDPDETTRVLTCVVNDGTANSNTLMPTVTVTAVNAPPMVVTDNFDTVGNTELVVGTGGPAAVSLATVAVPGGSVLGNDTDPDMNLPLTVVSATGVATDAIGPTFDIVTTNGGAVSMDSSGRFSYLPPRGVQNLVDSFTYGIQDAGGAGATGTVNINIVNFRVWYVHNDPAGEILNPIDGPNFGRSDDPFDLLAAAGAAHGANDLICVYEGTGDNTGMDTGIVLAADNVTLHGEHQGCTVPLSLNGLPSPEVLLAPTPNRHPHITHGAGNAISVDATAGNVTGIEIRGVDLSATGGNALDVTSGGANNVEVLFENSLVNGASGEGVDVNHPGSGLAIINVNNIPTFAATGNAFDARATGTGNLHVAFDNVGGITSANAAGAAIFVEDAGPGSAFVTSFSNNTVLGTSNGEGVRILGAVFDSDPADADFDPVTGGTLTVGTVIDRTRGGVTLGTPANRVSGNLGFGTVNIFTFAGAALSASGSGVAAGMPNPNMGFLLATTGGTADGIGGPALALDPLTANVSLGNGSSSMSPTNGVLLDNVSGTVNISMGGIVTATGASFDINGGTVSATYGGSIAHSTNSPMVNVRGGHNTGTVTFDTGNLNATNGTGLQFDNADGTYNFNGTSTLNGGDAGIDILNGSSGTFNFSANTAITHGGAGTAFNINNSTPTSDYNGTINDTNGLAVDIATLLAGGSARFDGQVTASGTGLRMNGAAGTVSFANADLSNAATVDIDNNTAVITFTDLDLNQTAGAVNAFDVNTGSANVTTTLTGNGLNSATPNRLVNVIGRSGGTVSFNGAATLQGTMGNTGINIGGNTNTAVTFNAPVDLGTSTANRITGGGVRLNGNTASTVTTFNSLDIFTNAVPGIVATDSGVLDTATLAGTANINTTGNGAAALDLDGIVANIIIDSAVCNTNTNCVDLTNLAATSVSSLTGLNLTCSAGTCFNGNAGRTVEVPTGGNIIVATGAVGLNLTNTTIGTGHVIFQQISASGAANGIVLNNTTGTTGDFTITGDAGSVQNGSGGTITMTTGDAISLTTTEDISIDQVAVSDIGRHGVSGLAVNNFTLTNSTFNLIGNANDENAFDFRVPSMSGLAAITGTLTLNNVDVTDFHDTGLAVLNESATATINVTNCDFDDNDDTNGTDAVFVESQMTAGLTLNVTGGLFNDLEGDVVVFEGGGSGTNDVNIVNTRSTNGGGPDDFPNGGGIEVRVSNGRTVTFDIQGNDLRDQRGDPLIIAAPVGAGGGNLEGRVGGPNPADGNTFSGSSLGDGIQLTLEGPNSNFTILIQNNDIGVDNTGMGGPFNGLGDDGIQILHRDSAGTLNLTIEDNVFANTVSEAIRFFSDEDTAIGANNPTSNVRIANNDFINIDTDNNENEIELRTSDTARACYHVTGNDNGAAGSPGTINFSIAGTSTGEITQASTAALSTANATATVTGDAPSTGGACTNPALPMN